VSEPLPSWTRGKLAAVTERLARRARGSVSDHLTWDRSLGLALALEELACQLDGEDEFVPRVVDDVRMLLEPKPLPPPPEVGSDLPLVGPATDADRLRDWLLDHAHAIIDLPDAPAEQRRTAGLSAWSERSPWSPRWPSRGPMPCRCSAK